MTSHMVVSAVLHIIIIVITALFWPTVCFWTRGKTDGSRKFALRSQHAPYVILISEHDDGPGIGGLQQPSDDLVKLPWPGLPRDLQGLGNAHTTWGRKRERGFESITSLICTFFSFVCTTHTPMLSLDLAYRQFMKALRCVKHSVSGPLLWFYISNRRSKSHK